MYEFWSSMNNNNFWIVDMPRYAMIVFVLFNAIAMFAPSPWIWKEACKTEETLVTIPVLVLL